MAAVGFHAPSWEELAHGAVQNQSFGMLTDPGLPHHGWQRTATIPVHGELVEGRTETLSVGAGFIQVARWPSVECPVHVLSHISSDTFRRLPFLCASPSAPLAPITPFLALLPVWPSP